MYLVYFRSENFGDELSNYIFSKLLPGCFDDDQSTLFYGIGSILGEDTFSKDAKRVVFSSGFGNYNGPPPTIDQSCDVMCVRGPVTADLLKIDRSLAITDGAALLKAFEFSPVKKVYDYAYIPHWFSEAKYPWERLCEAAEMHYISPTQPLEQVLDEIRKTKVIITEAMHGAIVADIFRIPWIPTKTFRDRYDVKWKDWTQSLALDYEPNQLYGIIESNDLVVDKIRNVVKLPKQTIKLGTKLYQTLQDNTLTSGNVVKLKKLKLAKQFLSKEELLDEKYLQLREKLDEFNSRYLT